MEDFKLIFYIGIAVAWFVYKNYQKVQQNRPKTMEPSKMNTGTSDAEKKPVAMTLEKIRQQKQVITAKKPESKQFIKPSQKTKEAKPVLKEGLKKKSMVASSYLNTETVPVYLQTVSDLKKDSETNPEVKKNAEDDLFDLKKFDIRTAIIFSEILKRPYV